MTLMECPHGCGFPPASPTELDKHLWLVHKGDFTVISKSPTDEEEAVLEAAEELYRARAAFSVEVLRAIATKTRSYDAQHAAQITDGRRVAMAEARYEIALQRLRKS